MTDTKVAPNPDAVKGVTYRAEGRNVVRDGRLYAFALAVDSVRNVDSEDDSRERAGRIAACLSACEGLATAKLEHAVAAPGEHRRLLNVGCVFDHAARDLEQKSKADNWESEALERIAFLHVPFSTVLRAYEAVEQLGGADIVIEKIRRGWTLQPPTAPDARR